LNVFCISAQTSDQQTVAETVPQSDSKSSSERLLAVPSSSVHDEAEEEVIKKGGMAAAIARSFVVGISLSRNDFGQVVHTHALLSSSSTMWYRPSKGSGSVKFFPGAIR